MTDDQILAHIAEYLRFEPETGRFYYIKSPARAAKVGREAGNLSNRGYRRLKIGGKSFGCHRLVWWLSTGAWPTDLLDHINGDKADNRISNLREADPAQNSWNRRVGKNNATGVPGVFWNTRRGRWQVQIKKDRKIVYGGVFFSFAEAVFERNSLANKLHGEFAKQFSAGAP